MGDCKFTLLQNKYYPIVRVYAQDKMNFFSYFHEL